VVIRALVRRSANSVIILTAAAAGLWLPHVKAFGALTVPIVAFLVYISFRGIEMDKIQNLARPYPIIITLFISYIALPIAAYALAPLLSEPQSKLGLYIVAAVPTTAGSSIVWTKLSQGDVELASVLAVVSIGSAPLVTPIVLSSLAGSVITLSAGAILTDLMIIIGGGIGLWIVFPQGTFSENQINHVSRASIATLVYVSVSQLNINEVPISIVLIVGVATALLFGGFLVSFIFYRIRRIAPGSESAVFFSGSLKNLGVGLLIADILSVPSATIVVVIYYICQQLAGALASDLIFSRN
jgi:predicted Na+-dependent transporter